MAPVDLAEVARLRDPHPVWARLREQAPVHRCLAEAGGEAWLLTRYADVREAHLDPRLTIDNRFAAGGYRGFALPPELDANLLNRDGPAHHRLRRMVASAFAPRRVSALRERIQAVAEELVVGWGRDADLVADYAVPLPVTIICELLGVPPAQRDRFKVWTNGMFAQDQGEVRESVNQIRGFLVDLVRSKRRHPSEDLLSDLVSLRDGEDRLSEEELLSTAMILMLAAYESPVHAVATAAATVLAHPTQLRELRESPELLPAAVDELLRFDPPTALSIRRFAVEDAVLGGVEIKAGDTVLFGQAPAHRDPREFRDPGTFDIHRHPQHLAFGRGAHFCLGSVLGRTEIEIALRVLLDRFPDLRLACDPEELPWRQSARSRGLTALPVRLR